MLKVKLEDNGIRTLQAESDADVVIVNTAVEMSETTAVCILGEDVDLIVLLMAKADAYKDIIFIKSRRGKMRDSLFSSRELQHQGFKDVLFLHAFTGCDTTYNIFPISKKQGRIFEVVSEVARDPESVSGLSDPFSTTA